MEPLLFKYKFTLSNSQNEYGFTYDKNEDLVTLMKDGKLEYAINSNEPFILGTKKAKIDNGEDQKATLLWK